MPTKKVKITKSTYKYVKTSGSKQRAVPKRKAR